MKSLILNEILSQISIKIQTLQQSVQSAIESRDNETKSSVGDKYETGRTMAQMELEKNRVQVNKTLTLKNELEQIDVHKHCKKVEFGSLVTTTNGSYFISIGIGKLLVNSQTIYCISLASPIGKALHNKTVNAKIKFQGREFTILEIN